MKTIESKFIKNLIDFNFNSRDEAIANFNRLWNDIGSYSKHIKKRIRNQDIKDEFDYLIKSFEVLVYTDYAYVEFYPNEELDIWDRIFYNKEQNWAVIIGENGKILTSYKIRDDIIKTLERHKELFQSKYEKKEVSDEFSKIVRQIYERLARV
jgi:hypothetical protein